MQLRFRGRNNWLMRLVLYVELNCLCECRAERPESPVKESNLPGMWDKAWLGPCGPDWLIRGFSSLEGK